MVSLSRNNLFQDIKDYMKTSYGIIALGQALSFARLTFYLHIVAHKAASTPPRIASSVPYDWAHSCPFEHVQLVSNGLYCRAS